MPSNDFVPFANSLANVMSLASYDPLAPAGNVTGLASSAYVNRALRQGTTMAAVIAQFLMNATGTSIADNQNTSDTAINATLYAQFVASEAFLPPGFFGAASGSGTMTPPIWYFIVTPSVQPAASAIYTDPNGVPMTVLQTKVFYGVTAVQFLQNSSFATPAVSGTITKTSGTGDATLSAYAVRTPVYGEVMAVGGGASGGGASGIASGSAAAGGGGGGAMFFQRITSLVYTGYAWVVGAGGAAPTAGANLGNNGVATQFNSTTAFPGAGGGAGTASTVFTKIAGIAFTTGGAALSALLTDWTAQGGSGECGLSFGAGTVLVGAGGSSFLSGRTCAQFANAAGGTVGQAGTAGATNSGGGGSGAYTINNGSAAAGGAGGSGYLSTRWYFQ